MRFSLSQSELHKSLQAVAGIAERKSTLPILSNVLLTVKTHQLILLTTDADIEMQAQVTLSEPAETGQTTVCARKFMEIARALPDTTPVDIQLNQDRLLIKSGRSRFSLATLPVEEFPNNQYDKDDIEFSIQQQSLKSLFANTQFAMAQQDVRYYLNATLLMIGERLIKAVATDGHRLAFCEAASEVESNVRRILLPRKAVLEITRLLDNSEDALMFKLGSQHFSVQANDFTLTGKLITDSFPDYNRVIPKLCDKRFCIERDVIKQVFNRIAVLSNDKTHGVLLKLSHNNLTVMSNNPQQEEAEESLEVDYTGEDVSMGFNVSYLLDVLQSSPNGKVSFAFSENNDSLYLESEETKQAGHVIMPMRLI